MSTSDVTTDIEWLRELEKKSWKDHPPDTFDRRKLGWREDLAVSKRDAEKALELFKKYKSELLFEPGSGVFGFGVCISAYEVIWPTYPGIPTEAKHIITLTSKQLFPKSTHKDTKVIYELFASFTHTEANQKLRDKVEAFKNIKLHSYSYYDY